MRPEPIATYRVQLRPGFGFDQASEIAPYLSDLGVSHLYTSPCLQAVAGSTHGYDVVDPSRVNEELGGAPAHARLCETLRTGGLGRMIDVVPNHMAIAGRQNPWWWDVLENGPSARYAKYFDVDWEAPEQRWPNKVLLPVLGEHYGLILDKGEFRLSHETGVFVLHYHEHSFPVDPSSVVELLHRVAESSRSELLAFIADSYARLPRPTVTAFQATERRHRNKAVLVELLAKLCSESPEINAAINAEVANLNGSIEAMDALIEQQNYRPAFWRTVTRDLGYRRFFDIKDLVGLRVEDIEVFHSTHALPIEWAQRGWAHGLRIDHPDGLRDPAEYFRRVREACPEAWIIAEKVLQPFEKLPADWPIAGTVGYDFLNLAGGLFIDPEGEQALARTFEDFTGEQTNFGMLVRECKRLVITELLGSELNRLTHLFVDVCEQHRRHRDYTSFELREALSETAVCFPVYRTYASPLNNSVGTADEGYISEAIKSAMAERPDLDPELFRFLRNLLLLKIAGPLESELAMRFQQLTSSAMAKGVEDTAFYRFNRLISLNEIGGDPSRFGISAAQFHQACAEAQAERPLSLLASTTHDTKRSEDVRARLALLSEIPEPWAAAVSRWAGHNQRHRRGKAPDRNTEYLFYQTLTGVWPITLERLTAYMEKAVREAKVRTSWTKQNKTYERGLQKFITAVMGDADFRADFEGFVASLVMPGRINSLAQTLIKLTAPGVPDIYQGTELWDMSLVDPDNRRPVDFTVRQLLLDEAKTLSPEEILARMEEGLPKLWVIRQALRFRRSRPEPFGPKGAYRPLFAHGGKARHAVAFIRGENAITVVPRLILRLEGDWADTVLELPAGNWRNVMTGEEWPGGAVRLKELLARFPVGLLAHKE